jgi:hypothetical protein
MVKYPHPDLETAAAKARHADIRREAERWRLARQGKQGPPSWLSPQGCWLLCQLGNALVWLGQWLEHYGSAAAAPDTESTWQAIVDRA